MRDLSVQDYEQLEAYTLFDFLGLVCIVNFFAK